MKNLFPVSQQSKNTYMITPLFLLRVGGLPINGIEALRFEQTLQWQNDLLLLENLLRAQKEGIVDRLFHCVNLYKEQKGLRQKLINLKRDIYNMHLPEDTYNTRRVIAFLPQEEQAPLSQWLDLWDSYQQLLASGLLILQHELQQKRHLLKAMINTDDFRKGILISSPLLDRAIDAYLSADNLHLSREFRTVERSLLEYLFRTTCKTSPFSTLTSVCIGSIEQRYEPENHSGNIHLRLNDMQKHSFTRLNMIVIARLSTMILNCSSIRNTLYIQLTNGWQMHANSITYVRRRAVTDDTTKQPADSVQEQVMRLPLRPLLRDLIAVLASNRRQLGTTIDLLCTQEQYQGKREHVETYLHHLLRIGFLIVPALQVDIHHDDPLTAFFQSLRAIAHPLTDVVTDELEKVEALVTTYATASLGTRRTLLHEIEQRLLYCGDQLGSTQERISLPKTLLYEDTVLQPEQLSISEHIWSPLFTQLAELQQLLPIFDSRVSERLTTRGYFQARYGRGQRCDDFLSFANTFTREFKFLQWRDLYQQRQSEDEKQLKRLENYFHLPEIDKMNTASQIAVDYIAKAYKEQMAYGDLQELVLGEAFFQTVVSHIPAIPGELQSNTFFSQLAHTNSETLLVLNQIYTGLTLMFSRFAYCFSNGQTNALVATLRTTLEQLQPPGTIFAELKGGYDATNLNLHPALTQYDLVCPGELSMRPPEEQIVLSDLSLQDDVETGCLRLYSRKLGKEIIPLYLGFLTPMVLPVIQQILLSFSYLSMCDMNVWRGIKIADPGASVIFYPRVRYKDIVLQRAMWQIAPDAIPVRESGQSDATFYLNVSRWRKEVGLPAQVFFSPGRILSTAAASDADTPSPRAIAASVSYKPLYVDFDNYLSVLLLEATIRQINVPFIMTEMLPSSNDLWFEHDRQSYVSEFVFEMSSRKDSNNA